MFNEFSSENLQQCPDNMRPTDLCFSPLPPSHLVTSPVGLIAITSHNFPLFEMLELERAWLFNNHFRLNTSLSRAADIGRKARKIPPSPGWKITPSLYAG